MGTGILYSSFVSDSTNIRNTIWCTTYLAEPKAMKTHGNNHQIYHHFHVLIIENDDHLSTSLVKALATYYQTSVLDEIANLPVLLSKYEISLIILNGDNCEDATFKWLKWLTANKPETPVIFFSESEIIFTAFKRN